MNYEFLGLIAGVFTTFSIVPQLYRVIKLKSAKEISLLFTIFLTFGIFLWLLYGILIESLPIIMWNAISFCLMCGLIMAKLKYGK
ncbi:SemiSWEET family sugar transporter [Chloroflexota bacterium]